MAVSLSKGGNVSLTKEAPGLTEVIVGLGWDPRVTDGQEFDLDASVFIVGENGKVLNDGSFVFYNNRWIWSGSASSNPTTAPSFIPAITARVRAMATMRDRKSVV